MRLANRMKFSKNVIRKNKRPSIVESLAIFR